MTTSRTVRDGVLVVGAGAAGVTAAGELRALGYDGRLTVVNGEADAPYNRTAVNKGLLQGEATLASVTLHLPKDDELVVRHGHRVTALDLRTRAASLATGETLAYDVVLIATGADPRTPVPHPAELVDRIAVLRTAADARSLRARLDHAASVRGDRAVRVCILGAGLLGAETADTLAASGAEVTLVDPHPAPLRRLFGTRVAGWVVDRQRERMRVAFGASVIAVDPAGAAVSVRLSDGERVAADLVLVSAGVAPATTWLPPGLPDPRDGVLTDDRLRVVDADDAYAAGDVARVRAGGSVTRGEHWSHALAQGRHAARVIGHDLGLAPDAGPFDAPASFATRLHGKAITVLGRRGPDTREVLLTGTAGEAGVSMGFVDDSGRLLGAVTLGAPKVANRLRPLVVARAGLPDVLAGLDAPVAVAG